MTDRTDAVVAELMRRHGRTYAEDAGFSVKDSPAALYQLLCLSLLLSARIRAEVAVAASRALRRAGWTTPRKLAGSTWADRARVLNESGYARYDERTSTMLGDATGLLLDEYGGDLRRLHERAGGDMGELHGLLTGFKGIGNVGADIFLREVQGAWRDVAPYVDGRAARGARSLGLPTSPDELAGLVEPAQLPRLVAALVRVTLARDAGQIKG